MVAMEAATGYKARGNDLVQPYSNFYTSKDYCATDTPVYVVKDDITAEGDVFKMIWLH